MERKVRVPWEYVLWIAVIVQTVMTSDTNSTAAQPQPPEEFIPELYAWTAWGSWSPCSRTCGGGISVQERQCLPRKRNASSLPAVNGTLPPPVITVRVTRQTHQDDCVGVSKRYHQCNTNPCPGGLINSRAEQCAEYDRRPFRGQFYTWMPYIDGEKPCTLNCRPLGQHFYAALSLVADGTPCTKPGYNAICIQGSCKVVGRESVLATTSSRDMRCGRRLVSGVFSRPRLELGYSYVTTVPQGACKLNVSEVVPSDNYIALKISNSSYIINGEFAVSAPGSYEAAGARFLYTRSAGLDSVFAMGPLHHSIDIMILYTQPNPGIKYEYFTESSPGDTEYDSNTRPDASDVPATSSSKHIRRHFLRPSVTDTTKDDSTVEDSIEGNIYGSRKFMWKIVSYTQCTRTCGGGIQLGKYRCVESSSNAPDREVSSVHCVGSPPTGRRRRCGNVPCPPRWRSTAWSSCPKCGPATRTRIVGCVQDHSRGITKISDQKCPAPKPSTIESCDIPLCAQFVAGVLTQESKRGIRPRDSTDTFRQGPVYTLEVNSTGLDIGPEYSFRATTSWLYTDWSDCVGWCVGGGVQTRAVRCADPSGCAPRKTPEVIRECNPKLSCEPMEGQWFTGEWSRCSSECGGRQVRGVLCIGGSGRHLRDSACRGPKPEHERSCGPDCPPTWYFGDWEQCIGNCSVDTTSGVQRRTVVCTGEGVGSESECTSPRPRSLRTCVPACTSSSTPSLPTDLHIESQVALGYETSTTTQRVVTRDQGSKHCEDKLSNCALAVQARLCHYNYYTHNCCDSCFGR